MKSFVFSLISIIIFFCSIFLIVAVPIFVVLVRNYLVYKRSAYYQVTKLPYFSVRTDKGRYGEYLTYKYLKHFESKGVKFLFNVYIPKDDGETTEIDVLMISRKGVFVFESKNYSGWIFGNESKKNWYQTLPAGRGKSHKESFYNPIMQNRTHIIHLISLLGEHIPMRSIIVFSERCTLKNIEIKSKDICVINRYDVAKIVSDIYNQTTVDLLDENNISDIYDKLYPFSQVDELTKKHHIENINDSHTEKHEIQTQSVDTIDAITDAQIEPTEVTSEIERTSVIETNSIETQVLKCPRCNAELVLRTATKGKNAGNQFYGCSKFPKCRYIQKVQKRV